MTATLNRIKWYKHSSSDELCYVLYNMHQLYVYYLSPASSGQHNGIYLISIL